MGTVQMSVEQCLLTRLLTESQKYHIGDLKKNLTNSRSPAHMEDDKKVTGFPEKQIQCRLHMI